MGIIGITGYKRSGKNTVADIIKKHYPEYCLYAFADPLKKAVSLVYDVNVEDLSNEEFRSKPSYLLGGNTFRYALQKIGTEGFRAVHANTWIDCAARFIQTKENVIITDVRFTNEASFIKQQNGIIISVSRSSVKPLNSSFKFWKKSLHESESYIDYLTSKADYAIYNEWGLSELENKVLDVMSKIKR